MHFWVILAVNYSRTLGTVIRRTEGQSRQRSRCVQWILKNKQDPEIRIGTDQNRR